jgi:hypothetical protein
MKCMLLTKFISMAFRCDLPSLCLKSEKITHKISSAQVGKWQISRCVRSENETGFETENWIKKKLEFLIIIVYDSRSLFRFSRSLTCQHHHRTSIKFTAPNWFFGCLCFRRASLISSEFFSHFSIIFMNFFHCTSGWIFSSNFITKIHHVQNEFCLIKRKIVFDNFL